MPPKSKSTGLETLEHGVLLKFAEELQAKNDTLVSALKACVGMLFGAANVLQANGLSIEQSGLLETAEMLLEQVKKGKAKPKSVKRPAAGAKQAPRKTAKGKPQGGAADGSNFAAEDEDGEEGDEEEEEDDEVAMTQHGGASSGMSIYNRFPTPGDSHNLEYAMYAKADEAEKAEIMRKAQNAALHEFFGGNVENQLITAEMYQKDPGLLQCLLDKVVAECKKEQLKLEASGQITPRQIKSELETYYKNAVKAEGEQKSV